MREIELLDAIKRRVKEALRDLRYPTADNNLQDREPTVIKGFYMKDEGSAFVDSDVDEVAPFIIVRPKKGSEIARDEFKIDTEIIIQIYDDSEDKTGHLLLLSAMNRIRANIFENQILDNTFIYDGGFTWEIPEEQPVPNWQMGIMCSWLIPAVQRTDIAEYI